MNSDYKYDDSIKKIYERIALMEAKRLTDAQKRNQKIENVLKTKYDHLDLGEIGALVEEYNCTGWQIPLSLGSNDDDKPYWQYNNEFYLIFLSRSIFNWFNSLYNPIKYPKRIPPWGLPDGPHFAGGHFWDFKIDSSSRFIEIARPEIINKEKVAYSKFGGSVDKFIMPWDQLSKIIFTTLQQPTNLPRDIINIISDYWLGLFNI